LADECHQVLFATHEVELSKVAIEAISTALDAEPTVGLVGPCLVDKSDPSRVWSLGGTLSPIRQRPRHKGQGSRASDAFAGAVACEWVDGACFGARIADLEAIGGVAEDYFLYLEDVDLGARVRHRLNRHVIVLPNVTIGQASAGGISTFLAVRNQALYLIRWSDRARLAIFLFEQILRLLAVRVLRPDGWRSRARDRARALRETWPESRIRLLHAS
jgi:GT2 family glycosyltransferase